VSENKKNTAYTKAGNKNNQQKTTRIPSKNIPPQAKNRRQTSIGRNTIHKPQPKIKEADVLKKMQQSFNERYYNMNQNLAQKQSANSNQQPNLGNSNNNAMPNYQNSPYANNLSGGNDPYNNPYGNYGSYYQPNDAGFGAAPPPQQNTNQQANTPNSNGNNNQGQNPQQKNNNSLGTLGQLAPLFNLLGGQNQQIGKLLGSLGDGKMDMGKMINSVVPALTKSQDGESGGGLNGILNMFSPQKAPKKEPRKQHQSSNSTNQKSSKGIKDYKRT